MNCGHYRNKPVRWKTQVQPGRLDSIVEKSIVLEEEYRDNMSSQLISVDLNSFEMMFDSKIYPIAASGSLTPLGEYIVCEKWEFPYYKSKDNVYLPGRRNPIGNYLVILADLENEVKLKQAIHAWPLSRYGIKSFRQGDNSHGCIRLSSKNIKQFFAQVELGANVNIKK